MKEVGKGNEMKRMTEGKRNVNKRKTMKEGGKEEMKGKE